MPVTVPVNPSSVYSDPGNHPDDDRDHGHVVIHDEDVGKDDDNTSLLNIFKMTQVQFFRPAHFISSSCVTTAAFTGLDTEYLNCIWGICDEDGGVGGVC